MIFPNDEVKVKTRFWTIALLSSFAAGAAHSAPASETPKKFFGETVMVSTQPDSILRKGSDGAAGYNGADAPDTSCSGSTSIENGYDGYMGDNGADGDDGPNVELVTSSLALLANEKIVSLGGNGGPGGAGGRGGAGCDGGGNFGASGFEGKKGHLGTIYVVLGTQSVPAASEFDDEVSLSLGQLLEKSVELNRNYWQRRSGALRLLAPGSQVQDSYYEFKRRMHASVTVSYTGAEKLSAADLEKPVRLFITTDDSINLEFADRVAKAEIQKNGDQYLFTILGFYSRAQLFNMKATMVGDVHKSRGVFGPDDQAQVIVKDLSGLPGTVSMTLQLPACETSLAQSMNFDRLVTFDFKQRPASSYCVQVAGPDSGRNQPNDYFSNYNANAVVTDKYIKKTPTGFVIAIGRFAADQTARTRARSNPYLSAPWMGSRGAILRMKKTYNGSTLTQEFQLN